VSNKQFYQEKSAYLTALIAYLTTAQRVCETLDRHEKSAPGGPDPDYIAIKEMLKDTITAAEGLRNSIDELA